MVAINRSSTSTTNNFFLLCSLLAAVPPKQPHHWQCPILRMPSAVGWWPSLSQKRVAFQRRVGTVSSRAKTRLWADGRLLLAAVYLIILILTLWAWYALWARTNTIDWVHVYSSSQQLPLPRTAQGQQFPMNHTTMLTDRPHRPIVIAYAVSLIKVGIVPVSQCYSAHASLSWYHTDVILPVTLPPSSLFRLTIIAMPQCGDFQSTAVGLVEAAIVLRHSIHQLSSRVGKSNYDYHMYAIVETGAKDCSAVLEQIGFTILHRDAPVSIQDIQDPFLRNNIRREWCCGEKEFVKLYAYTLNEPVVVHVDIDFVMHKPLDNLIDVLLYAKDSEIGRRARLRLEVERRHSPTELVPLPDQPQAAFTKDWGQVVPGYQPLFQAGFLVARTNPQVLYDVTHIIKTETYVPQSEGVGFKNLGWAGTGIGTYVGAMAMQGVMAFYYEKKAPGTWIELNQCRYNHMGMDAKMRGEPNFVPKHKGKCRNNSTYCEDCMVTPLDNIYNIHYTQCRKPWLCIGEGNEGIPRRVRDRTRRDKLLLPVKSVHVDHCLQLAKVWHDYRTDLETKLLKLTGDDGIGAGQTGTYMPQVFGGHCTELGPQGYLPMGASKESLKRVRELYGEGHGHGD